MTKHYVLSVNPSAEYDWDRCILRDPITAERPEFAQLIAKAVGEQSGSYLVSVEIQVKVLEQSTLPQTNSVVKPVPLKSEGAPYNHPKEMVA